MLRPHLKAVVAAGLILLIVSMGMNIVFAVNSNAEPGSDQDPIVSKSYVDAAISQLTSRVQLLLEQNDSLKSQNSQLAERLTAQEQTVRSLQDELNAVKTGITTTPSKTGTGTTPGNAGSTGTKPPTTTATGKAVINTAILNLRAQPNTTSAIQAKLVKNETVTLVSKIGDWYKITTSKGKTGFVMAKFLTKK
ncbi:MAG TPA: SH3 domain-containing protein [Clostridia bacterium]|nr:SH3 domain-containing protein [Clostridia bacterium]